MMAYIQILAIVLCSCFLQDAFSLTRNQRVKLTSANAVVPSDAGQTMRRVNTMRRTVSGKDIAAPVPPPPAPAKYPNLAVVKNMFWNTFEDINRNGENGQRGVRSARNTLSNVLSNELFWTSIVGTLKRRAKVTNDVKRADNKIRMCNNLTGLITAPNATDGFQDMANEVYASVVRMQSEVGTNALRLITQMVNGGEVTRGLDAISNAVAKIKINPMMLIKGFTMIRKTLNPGSTLKMGGGLAKGLMSMTSRFSK